MEFNKGKISLIVLLFSTLTWGQNQVSDSINRSVCTDHLKKRRKKEINLSLI